MVEGRFQSFSHAWPMNITRFRGGILRTLGVLTALVIFAFEIKAYLFSESEQKKTQIHNTKLHFQSVFCETSPTCLSHLAAG